MLLDRQDATRLQRGVEIPHGFLGDTGLVHPVVQVARQQHEIGTARRHERAGGLVEHRRLHISVQRFVGKLRRQRARCARQRGNVFAARRLRVGSEYLRPVSAAWPDFENTHARPETPERETLARMAVAVARHVFRCAIRTAHGERKRRIGIDAGLHAGRYSVSRQRHNRGQNREECSNGAQAHKSLLLHFVILFAQKRWSKQPRSRLGEGVRHGVPHELARQIEVEAHCGGASSQRTGAHPQCGRSARCRASGR